MAEDIRLIKTHRKKSKQVIVFVIGNDVEAQTLVFLLMQPANAVSDCGDNQLDEVLLPSPMTLTIQLLIIA